MAQDGGAGGLRRTAAGSSAVSQKGAPALLLATGEPLARTWTGDEQLDRGLAATSAREAAAVWFGRDRATRPVIRALASSLIGRPEHRRPGRNADLFAVSVALAVDPDDDMERLAPDDVATILAAALVPGALPRRDPLRRFPRETFQQLVTGWTRRQRRDLAIAVVQDADGEAHRFLRALIRAADIADVGSFVTPHLSLPQLTQYLRYLLADHEVLTRHQVLTAARPWRGREVIELADGWQVRVPWNRRLLEREGASFRNCLGSWYRPIHLDRRLVATVYRAELPLAAVEIGPTREVETMLGVGDEALPSHLRDQVEAALIAAGVVVDRQGRDLPTTGHRLAARVACRAAVLAAGSLEPSLEERLRSGEQRGDRLLGDLDHRQVVLTDEELGALRSGVLPDTVTGWATVGALLVAAGATDPTLTALDGGAVFRRTAMVTALGILRGDDLVGIPCEPRWLVLALGDERLPDWQRDAFVDALGQHPGHRFPDRLRASTGRR